MQSVAALLPAGELEWSGQLVHSEAPADRETGHPCQHQQSAGESLGVVIHECVSMCEGEREGGRSGGEAMFLPPSVACVCVACECER